MMELMVTEHVSVMIRHGVELIVILAHLHLFKMVQIVMNALMTIRMAQIVIYYAQNIMVTYVMITEHVILVVQEMDHVLVIIIHL